MHIQPCPLAGWKSGNTLISLGLEQLNSRYTRCGSDGHSWAPLKPSETNRIVTGMNGIRGLGSPLMLPDLHDIQVDFVNSVGGVAQHFHDWHSRLAELAPHAKFTLPEHWMRPVTQGIDRHATGPL